MPWPPENHLGAEGSVILLAEFVHGLFGYIIDNDTDMIDFSSRGYQWNNCRVLVHMRRRAGNWAIGFEFK